MRLFMLLAFIVVVMMSIGVLSFHWSANTMSVEFDKQKALEATGKVIETGKEITSGLSQSFQESEKKTESADESSVDKPETQQ